MKKTKVETQEVEVIDDVICNKCGQSCKCEMNFNGLIEIDVFGAYDSPVFNDLEQYEFSLCENCLKELFDTFKIPAEKHELNYG